MSASTDSSSRARRIMVEFAQPNTHKDFHVGHLRNASIGQAIANLLEHSGNRVYKATYIGDVGLHVAKAMVGHSMGLTSGITGGDRLEYWGRNYKAANARFEEEAIQTAARNWLISWEEGDAAARSEWQTSRDECVAAFRGIFDELLLDFTETAELDLWFYESTIDDTKLGQKTAQELLERGIAEVDQSEKYKGSLFVDFEKQADALRPDGTSVFRDDEKKGIRRLGKMVILRSDGTSLYQTKELGLAKYKFDLIREKTGAELDESLYVVGAEQKLYFQQVLAILRLWGFPNAENCRHISYELVVLPEGKMSSREGTIVSYRELRDEAIRRAREVIVEKGIITDEASIDETARMVAIAAIKYTMLQVSGNQSIVFDMEQALSFSGRAAPYMQYAYARAGKLVKDDAGDSKSPLPGGAGVPARDSGAEGPGYDLLPSEVELARQISLFPDVIEAAAQRYEPALVCGYLYSLAASFSDFYRDCRVLDAPEPERSFRRSLVRAFRQVIKNGFRILALPLPEEM